MNNIKYYISDIYDGNLALHIGDNETNVLNNRKKISFKLGFELDEFIYLNQIHGDEVMVANDFDKGKGVQEIYKDLSYDAIITTREDIVIGVLVADCLGVIFYDAQNGVIGVAHAGWKGTHKNIVKKTIDKMIESGANIENIKIIISPGISKYSYEVGGEVGEKFREEVTSKLRNNKQMLDLKKENKLQLLECGIKESNIEIIKVDTYKNPNYFSARRDGFSKGRFGVFIYMK